MTGWATGVGRAAARDHDERAAVLSAEAHAAAARAAVAFQGMMWAAEQVVGRGGRLPQHDTVAEAVAWIDGLLEAKPTRLAQLNLRQQRATFTRLAADYAVAVTDRDKWEDSYLGWPRVFVVPGGGVHSRSDCVKVRSRTRLEWDTSLSGATWPEIAFKYGALLCRTCLPTPDGAVVDGDPVKGRAAAAKREARSVRCPRSGKPTPTKALLSPGDVVECRSCGERVQITEAGRFPQHGGVS